MLLYIFQVTICWACFYALYQLLYKQETFFRLNRFYLLSTLALGLLLPFDWSGLRNISHESAPLPMVYLEPFVVGSQTAGAKVQQWQFDFNYWLSITYVIGASVLLLRFLWGMYRLFSIFREGKKDEKIGYTLVETGKNHLPFTFFSYIFWGNFSETDDTAQQLILRHEIAHVKQKHSVDTLLLELLNILFWCSPMIYFYKKSLKTVHEYLADEAVVTAQSSKKEYGTVLLRQVSSGPSPALSHSFSSQLKLRFAMLLKRNSSRWAYLKYALCIPTLLIISVLLQAQTDLDMPIVTIDPVGGTRFETYKDMKVITSRDTVVTFNPTTFEEKITIVTGVDSVFLKPDKPAEFIGGQAMLFKLLGATIKYPQEARDKGIEGKNVIQFMVTKEGFTSLSSFKLKKSSGNKALDDESHRVILAMEYAEKESNIPYWIPGEKDGKPVATEFTLPLVYKLEEKDKKK